MSHIAKKRLQDCSTKDAFSFSLCCAECGEVWKSRRILFSRAGVIPETPGKRVVFDALYQRERTAALEQAAIDTAAVFNVCPICHRLVCDHCFLICEDLDLCQSCAEKLQVEGERVAIREKQVG